MLVAGCGYYAVLDRDGNFFNGHQIAFLDEEDAVAYQERHKIEGGEVRYFVAKV